jgi:hypothetical protein
MTFTKNIGMLLLAIYLILVGLIAVFGFNFGLFQGSSLFSLASSSFSGANEFTRDCLSRRDGAHPSLGHPERKSRDPVGGYL